MQTTSPQFKNAIFAPMRRTTGRVTFDISDLTASGDVQSITTTPESPLSLKSQLINKVRNSSYKNATLETDRFKLDGSFSFPDDTISNNGELGWSSADICDAMGSFYINNLLATDLNTSKFIGWVNYNGAVVTLTQGQQDPLGGSGATLIQSTGGTVTNKYYRSAGTGVSGTNNNVSIWVKNLNSLPISIVTNIGSNISIPANSDWVKISVQRTSNGTTQRQIQFVTQSVGDSLNVLAFQPQITETSYEQPFTVGTSTYPAFTFLFNSNHSSAGLTITFDQSTGEYATDFDMTAYDASNAVIATTSVTGNTNVIAVPLGQLYNYRKVAVTIKKWSVPNRRARVFEVDFGFVKQYTDESLISMNLIEEMDMLTGKLPSPEFKFTIDNVDRAFNILNPSGFYKYLQQKQQVIAEIGLEVAPDVFEFVQLGNYLLQEWKSDQGSITASFTARTNLDSMVSFDYENLTPTTKTLYQLAVDIFTVCGITNYSIDTALQAITTNSLVKKANCRDILQMIAIAGCANIYVTRGNIITIKANRTRKVRYIRDWLNGSTANTSSHWLEVQAIDGNGVNVALGKSVTTSFTPDLTFGGVPASAITDGVTTTTSYVWTGNVITGANNVVVDLGSSMDIAAVNVWHYYGTTRSYHNTKTEISEDGVTWTTIFDSAVSGEYVETSAGRTYSLETAPTPLVTVETANFDNMYNEPQITLDKAIKRVEVTYWSNLSTSAIVGVNSTTDTLGDTIKLENNTLINDSTRATAVANWFFAQIRNKATYKVKWRGNPATELNDVLSFENSYGDNMSAILTRYELDYAGYLVARIQAKGGVN